MHLVMVNMKQQMTTGTNDVHRFIRIGRIPAREKFNLQKKHLAQFLYRNL